MAHDVQRPRDKLFRTVFADAAEVAALLRAHLPEALDRWIRFRLLKYCCLEGSDEGTRATD